LCSCSCRHRSRQGRSLREPRTTARFTRVSMRRSARPKRQLDVGLVVEGSPPRGGDR
jgi:hypothetical protein